MSELKEFRTLTRRRFNHLTASSFAYLVALGLGAAVFLPRPGQANQKGKVQRPAKLGTTFSQLQCSYLGLDYREAFSKICSLGFDTIRICSYWNEIEPIENQFDFTTLDWLLEESQKYEIEVVLTVGMKAPRWPEYHFPTWLSDRYDTSGKPHPIDNNVAIADNTLAFIKTVVEHTRQAPNLRYWQVENEPFTQLAITAGRFLSYDFVRREVELVRKLALPGQKILLTNSISLPAADVAEDDRAFQESLLMADAVGVNVYTKVPIDAYSYLQPTASFWRKLQSWQTALKKSGREHWIAEAQAEPWEQDKLVAMDKTEYPSSSPKQTTDLTVWLSRMGYSTVMLWGCEYWFWHDKAGSNAWWKAVQELVEA